MQAPVEARASLLVAGQSKVRITTLRGGGASPLLWPMRLVCVAVGGSAEVAEQIVQFLLEVFKLAALFVGQRRFAVEHFGVV